MTKRVEHSNERQKLLKQNKLTYPALLEKQSKDGNLLNSLMATVYQWSTSCGAWWHPVLEGGSTGSSSVLPRLNVWLPVPIADGDTTSGSTSWVHGGIRYWKEAVRGLRPYYLDLNIWLPVPIADGDTTSGSTSWVHGGIRYWKEAVRGLRPYYLDLTVWLPVPIADGDTTSGSTSWVHGGIRYWKEAVRGLRPYYLDLNVWLPVTYRWWRHFIRWLT